MRILFIFSACLFQISASAQSEPALLLDQGLRAYNNKNADSAIFYWMRIVKEYPDSLVYYGRAMNNIPVAYEAMGNFEKASEAYHAILNSDLNDREDYHELMEPYANYRHNACMRLARMYAGWEKYQDALAYLEMAEHQFKYEAFSGTSYEKRMVSIASWRSSFYGELGKKDSAVYALVFKIFDNDVRIKLPDMRSFSNVDFYGRITEAVLPMIEEQYTLEGFKKELDKALSSLVVTVEDNYAYASFSLYGLLYRIPSSKKEDDAAAFIRDIRASRLYQELLQ